jgi:flagellar biosynthesis GTPase FlhF
MAAPANNWSSPNHSLNKNTEAIARAIWAQVQAGNNTINATSLKTVKKRITNGYYKPKPGVFAGLKGMFGTGAAKAPSPTNNGNIFYPAVNKSSWRNKLSSLKKAFKMTRTKTLLKIQNTAAIETAAVNQERINAKAVKNAETAKREANLQAANEKARATAAASEAARAKASAEKAARNATEAKRKNNAAAAKKAERERAAAEKAQLAAERAAAAAVKKEANAKLAAERAATKADEAKAKEKIDKINNFIVKNLWPKTEGNWKNSSKTVWASRQKSNNLKPVISKIITNRNLNKMQMAARINALINKGRIGKKFLGFGPANNNRNKRKEFSLQLLN